MNSDELKIIIREAFKDTPYPAGKLTDTYDDEGVSEYFTGKKWETLNISDLRKHYVALSFFEPQAFRYFLPAFMLAELTDPETADVIGQSIVFHFSKPNDYWVESYDKRLSLFTENEKNAIMHFIDYMQSTYGMFEDQVIYASTRLLS